LDRIKKQEDTGNQPEEDEQEGSKKAAKEFKMGYIWELMKFNKELWHLYVVGIVGSTLIGAIFPTFAYLLSNIIVTLSGIKYEKDSGRLEYYQN
jgi:hypothetical protein